MSKDGRIFLDSIQSNRGTTAFSTANIRAALERLGRPQDVLRAFHVGGTNGKGSVACALASIIGASGERTCLSISPHLHSYTERLVIDGIPVSEEYLYPYAEKLKKACDIEGIRLSLHEGMVALGFIAAASEGIPWIVLEVGLGGRRDSTNVINRPEVSIITSVDYDHVHLLGPTLADIAREKAGIIKENVPVITGVLPPEAAAVVVEEAANKRAPLFRLGEEFQIRSPGEVTFCDGESVAVTPSLPGEHQVENMALAAQAARMAGIDIPSIQRGIGSVFWPARLERVPLPAGECILDAAHNLGGIESLTRFLQKENLPKVTVVFGVLDTKDWKEMVNALLLVARSWLLVRPAHHRAIPPKDVRDYLSCLGISDTLVLEDDYEGCCKLMRDEGQNGPVVVAGSMYMVAKIRALLVKNDRPYWIKASLAN